MAAGLQSFQSNDKQMQAIRELTNEVFNLKQKQAQDENTINTLSDKFIVISKTGTTDSTGDILLSDYPVANYSIIGGYVNVSDYIIMQAGVSGVYLYARVLDQYGAAATNKSLTYTLILYKYA